MGKRLALITGGSRGIGAALVEAYVADGWTVREYSRSGASAHHVQCDLANSDEAVAVIERDLVVLARDAWTDVVFVNNAALLAPVGPVSRSDDAAITRNINVNLMSGGRLMAAFVRAFQSHAAAKSLVNISSGAAQKGYDGWSLYCMAKAGLDNFVNTIAEEQKRERHPIVCFNFAPGVVDTAMQDEIRKVSADDFPGVQAFHDHKAKGELRTPESVAAVLRSLVNTQAENGRRYRIQEFD